MIRRTAILTGLCLWSGAAFAADPQLMNLVMPTARVLAGVNAANARTSPLGQFLLARPLPPVFAAVGFNPATDLDELLFASAADPANPGGLALARGTFDVSQIAAAAATHKNLAIQTYDGYTLIVTTNPNGKVTDAVAFIGGTIAVAGDVADVKAALDRSSGANSINPSLAAQVNTLSAANDAWIASLTGPPSPRLQALKVIQSFGGGVQFGTEVVATGEAVASTPENATALADVIHLLISMGSKSAALNLVLMNLKASVTGDDVDLTLTLTEAQAETLINALAAQRRQGQSSVRAQRRVR